MSPSTSCSRIRASISKEPWVHVFSLRGRVPCLLQASPPLLFLFLLPPQISRPWLFSLCPGSFSSTNKASQVLPNTKKKKKKKSNHQLLLIAAPHEGGPPYCFYFLKLSPSTTRCNLVSAHHTVPFTNCSCAGHG